MKTTKPLKKSITNQYIRIMGILSIILLLGVAGIESYLHYYYSQFKTEKLRLEEKLTVGQQLERTFSSIFFDMRGYYAFNVKTMRDDALVKKTEAFQLIQSIKKGSTSKDEILFVTEATDFYFYYFQEVVPEQIQSFEAGNGAGTGDLVSQKDVTRQITEFQKSMKIYNEKIEEQIQQNFKDYTTKQDSIQWLFVVFVIVILMLSFIIVRLRLKKLGRPLYELAIASEDIAAGGEVEIPKYDGRDDEVSMLSRSFEKMIRSIQENEQNLLAQNEELMAQQDELQMQKEELEHAVDIIQTNEASLKRRNELMHSLSNSLNKQTVLEGVVENICRIMNADRGIITLMDSTKAYASFGLAETEKDQFMGNLHSGMIARLIEKKRAYRIKRNCTPLEKGYHTEELYCYDLYVPVLSSSGNVAAVMMFSRYANPYSKDEIKEYEGISKQISISLEKIRVYEESENNRLLTKDILDTIHEGVQLVDENGVVSLVNSKMQGLYQESDAADLLNLPLDQWSHKVSPSIGDAESFIDFMKAVMAGKATPEERHVYHINGSAKRVIQVYVEELYHGNKKFGTLLVHRDITKAYEVDQIKSEFVSTVSHELRTPLSSVLGFTELMLNKPLKPERQQKYLQTIYQEGKRLTALINDFLDVQRMESGKQTYDKKYVDIIPLINRGLDTGRVNHQEHTFILNTSTENTTVLGDEDKITQVLNNLLSNAVKYSPGGGEVKVTVYEKGSNLCIDVTDQGLGIPEDALENIFTRFYRVDNSDRRKIGGTGLGLSIVSEIMKAHEGSVHVTSELKKGSTFTLSFPLVLSKNIEAGKDGPNVSPDSMTNGVNVNVIVIEDDRNLASLLQTELEDNGFHVLQYTNGEDAMRAIEQHKPDTIVLDIMLNESSMNGWELLEKVKTNNDLKDIPIIVSSALEEKEKGVSLGATEYLVKPYPPHKLSSTILQTLLKKEKSGQILVPGSAE